MAEQWRKKPVVIEAVQWTGGNGGELREFVGEALLWSPTVCEFTIHTLEGYMRADKGDWIIRGVRGEFYPCKPEIFEATYERPADATREGVFCFECDDRSRCASAELCYASHKDYPKLTPPIQASDSERAQQDVEISLLRARLRTIHLADTFGSGNAEVAKRIAELENTSDQARQYIQNAQQREHRINELELQLAAIRAALGKEKRRGRWQRRGSSKWGK